MTKIAPLWALVFFLLPLFSSAQDEQNSPELVVHLLDYLAKDYGGSVQDGKVISPFEYTEQVDFAQIVKANARGTPSLSEDGAFMEGVLRLIEIIDQKGPAEEVSALARELQQEAIRLSNIVVAPSHPPDISTAPEIYRTNCALCHGETGRGDGPGGAGLDPAPSNFLDSELAWNSSPFKFYNTIRLGVPGTGMAAYSHLSDRDVWALAFYLKSLPYAGESYRESSPTLPSLNLSLKEIATLTDAEIAAKVESMPVDSERDGEMTGSLSAVPRSAVAQLRMSPTQPKSNDPLSTAKNLLKESLRAAQDEKYGEAQKLAIRAYLEGVEPIEPNLKGIAPGYVAQIESLMTSYRASLSNRAPIETTTAKYNEVIGNLVEIQNLLSQNQMSSAIAFGAAFSIFFREGFEALLIIVILISVLRAMDQPKAVKWVHVGWITALGVGIAAWVASGLILSMSGLSREVMEGAISLIAVAVLLYVGFWLHRYAEAKKWRNYLEDKLKKGLSAGSYFGIALVAFLAVFREAFEVVLFLRAIWVDLDTSGQTVAGMGVLSSFSVLLVVSYLFVKRSRKIPITFLFRICSWTMIALAVILAGKGVYSLQEAGVASITPLSWIPRIELLGIYPNLQAVTLQLITASFFAALIILESRKSTKV